jgi:hypothetical protein
MDEWILIGNVLPKRSHRQRIQVKVLERYTALDLNTTRRLLRLSDKDYRFLLSHIVVHNRRRWLSLINAIANHPRLLSRLPPVHIDVSRLSDVLNAYQQSDSTIDYRRLADIACLIINRLRQEIERPLLPIEEDILEDAVIEDVFSVVTNKTTPSTPKRDAVSPEYKQLREEIRRSLKLRPKSTTATQIQ